MNAPMGGRFRWWGGLPFSIALENFGTPGWIRTIDHPIKSRMLYH